MSLHISPPLESFLLTTLPSQAACPHNPSDISSCREKGGPRQEGPLPLGQRQRMGRKQPHFALPRGLSGSWVREVKLDTLRHFQEQPCLRTLERRPKGTMPRPPWGPVSCLMHLLPRDHMQFLLEESGAVWVYPRGWGWGICKAEGLALSGE